MVLLQQNFNIKSPSKGEAVSTKRFLHMKHISRRDFIGQVFMSTGQHDASSDLSDFTD